MRAPSRLHLPAPGTSVATRRPRRIRRLVATALALGLLAAVTFSAGGASAQTVESLRSRAAQLANELEQLEVRASVLDEQYLQLEEELAAVREQRAENEDSVAAAQQRLDAASAEAAGYLVEAYIGAGSGSEILIGSNDPNEAVNSRFLMQFLRGDRQLLADEMAASRSQLEDSSAELARTGAVLSERQAEQRSVVQELEASIDRHDQLLNNTNAQLQEALDAERQRREAEAQARAEAAARQAAAAREAAARESAARESAARESAARSTSSSSSSASTSSTSPARSSAPDTRAPAAPAAAAPPPPSAPAPAPLPASPPNGRGGAAVAAAYTQMGKAYRWAGSSPATGFDCSGLTSWAWAQAGVSIPRTSGAQRAATQRITADQLQPGDLVFFGSPVHHVGMYVGGGQMIHSPRTGSVVHIASIHRGFGGGATYGRVG